MGHQLTIRDEGDGRLAVYLRRASQEFPERAGEPFAFTFPLNNQEREDLRWYLEDYLQAPYAVWEDRGQKVANKLDGWGETLFQAVFGTVKTHAAYTKARESAGAGELVIQSDNPILLGLPWELLKDSDRLTPLALDADFAAIDRTFEVEGAATEVSPGESLRVLMVIARPAGIQDVGYQMIARPLLERLHAVCGRVELEVLRPPTIDALEDRLKRAAEDGRPYQVLHFDGHGVLQQGMGAGFAPGSVPHDRYRVEGEGYLAFEKATGGSDAVPADTFARVVHAGRVPLVVLNACQSAAMSATAEAAVATRLLLEGAASVVAMGYSVYAVAAAEFMAAFYQALFEGKTVSAAVQAGRARLACRPDRPSPKGWLPLEDWMVPVHYLRRAVSFAELKQRQQPSALTLDSMLDELRGEGGEQAAADVLAPVGRFVGRDAAFYTLELALQWQRVVVVHGPAGTGKTELAKAFGRWWQATGGVEDPDGVFFYAFEPGIPSFGLDGVVTAVGLQLFGPDFVGKTKDAAQRCQLLLRVLRERRLLLIWDNFESVRELPDPTGATPPLDAAEQRQMREFLAAVARDGKSGVIVTSRTPEQWLGEVRRVELGGLLPAEAAEMAENVLRPYPKARARRQERAFAELLDWLDGHPLSLRLLLPQLEQVSPSLLLEALKGHMAALPAGFVGEGRLESLGASLKYSFDHLAPEMRERLPALSLFEGVTDEEVLALFSAASEVPKRFAGWSKEAWREILQATATVGLLTPLWGRQYGVHPALPAYLAAQWRRETGQGFEEERHAARRALLTAYAHFGGWLLQHLRTGSAEMAMALIEQQRRTMGQLLAFAISEGRYIEAQQILQPLNDFWKARGLAEEARGWIDRVRRAVEGERGAAPDFGSASGVLWLFAVTIAADWARQAGDLASAEHEYDVIRRTLEAAPPGNTRDSHLADLYHNIGIVKQHRGDLAAAEEWYRKSLATEQAHDNRPGMAVSYQQLGVVAHLRHDPAAAEEWSQKALAIRKERGDRPGMAASYQQLGVVADDRGNLAAAEAWYLKALAIFEDLGDRPGMAAIYQNLCVIAHRGQDCAAAKKWSTKALGIFENLGDRLGTARSYQQLGSVAAVCGDLAAAEAWSMKALGIFENLGYHFGYHPEMAAIYHNLGVIAQHRGDLAAAEAWSTKALAMEDALT